MHCTCCPLSGVKQTWAIRGVATSKQLCRTLRQQLLPPSRRCRWQCVGCARDQIGNFAIAHCGWKFFPDLRYGFYRRRGWRSCAKTFCRWWPWLRCSQGEDRVTRRVICRSTSPVFSGVAQHVEDGQTNRFSVFAFPHGQPAEIKQQPDDLIGEGCRCDLAAFPLPFTIAPGARGAGAAGAGPPDQNGGGISASPVTRVTLVTLISPPHSGSDHGVPHRLEAETEDIRRASVTIVTVAIALRDVRL